MKNYPESDDDGSSSWEEFAVAGDRSGFARRDDWATAAIDDTNIPATLASLSDHEAPHIVSPRAEIRQRCSSKSVFGSAAHLTSARHLRQQDTIAESTTQAACRHFYRSYYS